MSISRMLSTLTLETSNDVIERSTYDAAVRMLIDTLSCAYAGRYAPGIETIIELERELSGHGKGTVFLSDMNMALPSAAYCNSAMIHALDFDNNYPTADIHILSIVVPIAIACAEQTGKSGRDILSAIILGVETAARIAKPYIKAKRRHNYFLTTSLVGGWGGVATAARLLSLSLDETVNAMGIYYAHTCGNRQALLEKALTKRIQPGIAAKSAVYSVLLGQKGFSGPEYVFEGAGGFYRCYTLEGPPSIDVFAGEPEPWGIEELAIKKYPTCGIHHACIESALYLRKKYELTYEDIERVEFYLLEGGGTLVSMPFDENGIVQVAAQFCAPYAIALALCRGDAGIARFTNEAIRNDHETMELAARTQEVTSFKEMGLRNYASAEPDYRYLKVYLRNGQIVEDGHCSMALCDIGTGDMALVKKKLTECVGVYGKGKGGLVERIMDAAVGLYDAEDCGELVGLLRGTGG